VADKTVRILFQKGSAGKNGSGVIVNATRAGDGTGLRDGKNNARNRPAGKRRKGLRNFTLKKHFARISVRKMPTTHDPSKIRTDFEASFPPESPSIRKEGLSPLSVTPTDPQTPNNLPHLTSDGSAHMVSVTSKNPTHRVAVAVGTVSFSVPETYHLIRENLIRKGDVLGTARIAGIMGAKSCPALVPLCHPIVLSGVAVDVKLLSPDETHTGRCRAASSIEDKSGELSDRFNNLKSKQDEFADNLGWAMRKLMEIASRALQRLHHSEVNKIVNQEGIQDQVLLLKALEKVMEKSTEAIASIKDAQDGFQSAFNDLQQSVKAFSSESNETSNLSDQDGDRTRSSKSHGCVRIEAKVECVGPTGVEMEALTAVSAAALTVIDMIKAVDRNARVDGVKMVMKKGGRSGMHIDHMWAGSE
jgi:molybdenum cofactor biosynthesis protein MoaC